MSFISFSFTYVTGESEFTWSGYKGAANEQEISLGNTGMSMAAVAETMARPERLIIALRQGAQIDPNLAKHVEDGVLVLNIMDVDTLKIKRVIDRHSSAISTREHKKQLDAQGQGASFRSQICPTCQSTINLTGLPETAYHFCPFCESVYMAGGALVNKGEDYCTCDECELFGHVQEYKIFYFYFLLVIYGWRSQQRFLCDGCARGELLKTLLCNLFFILGVPVSLWGLFRSYSGQDPRFNNLVEANDYAREGKADLAGNIYQQISGSNPMHPGLAMNKGLACLHSNNVNGAIESFSTALESCSNYVPAIRLLQRIAPHQQAQ